MPAGSKRQWKRDERTIVQIEQSIRSIDPIAPEFWTEYRMLEELLIHRYHQLGITLHH